jgi:hypothetical protein
MLFADHEKGYDENIYIEVLKFYIIVLLLASVLAATF